MTVIIIVATIILYLILLVFTWHNLDMLEGQAKIMYIAAETIAMFIITLIVFNISTNGVQYENENKVNFSEKELNEILKLKFFIEENLEKMIEKSNKM